MGCKLSSTRAVLHHPSWRDNSMTQTGWWAAPHFNKDRISSLNITITPVLHVYIYIYIDIFLQPSKIVHSATSNLVTRISFSWLWYCKEMSFSASKESELTLGDLDHVGHQSHHPFLQWDVDLLLLSSSAFSLASASNYPPSPSRQHYHSQTQPDPWLGPLASAALFMFPCTQAKASAGGKTHNTTYNWNQTLQKSSQQNPCLQSGGNPRPEVCSLWKSTWNAGIEVRQGMHPLSTIPKAWRTNNHLLIVLRICNLKKDSIQIRVSTPSSALTNITKWESPNLQQQQQNCLSNPQNLQNIDDLGLQIQSSRGAPTVVLAHSKWWMDGSYIPLGRLWAVDTVAVWGHAPYALADRGRMCHCSSYDHEVHAVLLAYWHLQGWIHSPDHPHPLPLHHPPLVDSLQ